MLRLPIVFFVKITGVVLVVGAVKNNEPRSSTQEVENYYRFPCRHDSLNPCTTYHNHEGYPAYPPPNFHHNQFPPGFSHNHEIPDRNFGGGRRDGRKYSQIDENAGTRREHVSESKNLTIREIPLRYLKRFDNLDVNDLLLEYVEGYEGSEEVHNRAKPTVGNRFGTDDSQERKSSPIPPKAGCIPELISVPLGNSEDPTVVYIPKCTRIERCGGCCSHKLLACQPTETELISLPVVRAQYTGAKKLKYLGKELIAVEKHTKCKCDCKVKAEHCLPNQQYKAAECGCECTNIDEENKCRRDSDKKFWDYETCTCVCRNIIECSTGSVYDNNECRCKMLPKRRYAKTEARREELHVEFLE